MRSFGYGQAICCRLSQMLPGPRVLLAQHLKPFDLAYGSHLELFMPKKKKVDELELATFAKAGDVKAIYKIADLDSDTDNDRLAYKWLNAASDLGHAKEAKPLIDDLLEVSNLRYDDDGFEIASAHYELATLYLEGSGGLPFDLRRAKTHLGQAFELHDLQSLNGGTSRNYSAKALLGRLKPEAKALLQKMLAQRD